MFAGYKNEHLLTNHHHSGDLKRFLSQPISEPKTGTGKRLLLPLAATQNDVPSLTSGAYNNHFSSCMRFSVV